MIKEQFDIIEVFSGGINVELTIHQISKILKKSYAFTNKYTHELIQADILTKRAIGSAILCSLNFQNEETIAALVYNSIRKKTSFDNSSVKSPAKSQYHEIIQENESQNAIFIAYDQKLMAIFPDEKAFKSGKKETSAITYDSFRKDIKKYDFSKIVVLKEHERFWRLVAKVTL
jgi:hypothetical protein